MAACRFPRLPLPAACPSRPQKAVATAAARSKLDAMKPAELARFVQRCRRRQEPKAEGQQTAEPAEPAAPVVTGAQPQRDPTKSLRDWTDVISGGYDNGGPGVDMCVLAVTERAMHSGMVDVLNAEATTAGTANQELLKNRITTDGIDLTAVAERRPGGTAKLGVVPGENYQVNQPTGNPPNIAPFVRSTQISPVKAPAPAAAAPATEGGKEAAPSEGAAAPATDAPAAFLQASASQDDAPPGDGAGSEAPSGDGAGSEAPSGDGADSEAPSGGDSGSADAAPPASGLMMDPMPGWHGVPPVNVLPLTAVGGNLPATSHYGLIHSYVEDLGVLVAELDESEAKARKLRMMIVEKDNFLGGLQKREKLLRMDMTLHKQTLAALAAHMQAVSARIGRLKQERQLSEIAAQKHQFDSATAKLNVELGGIRAVSNALDSRIKHLDGGVMNNMAAEIEAMRRSVQPEVAAGMRRDEGAAAAVLETVGGSPPEAFLQRSALRGSARQ